MWAVYDKEADVFSMGTGEKVGETAGLWGPHELALDMATEDGQDVIGFILVGASHYLPLGEGAGYGAENDILTVGNSTDDPDFIIENGDFIGFWMDPGFGDGSLDPIGVAVRRASTHLSNEKITIL